MVFYQSGTTCQTWAEKGNGIISESAPGRKTKKALGVVSVEKDPKFYFRFEEVFNASTFQAFLQKIVNRYRNRKVFLIMDNAKYHHSNKLKPWLEDNMDKIELHFLPAYSPNLNPIERVWKKAKKSSLHNRYFKEISDLQEAIFRRFNRFQGNPAALRGAVKDFI